MEGLQCMVLKIFWDFNKKSEYEKCAEALLWAKGEGKYLTKAP